MEYRTVPKTGWDVSTLSFGCMRFNDPESAAAAVSKAVELGVNYFDVAPAYCGAHSEEWLGGAIAALPREKLIVTAKSSPGNGGEALGEYNPETGFGILTADQARSQIERSMQRLGVDHLDMYQFWALHSQAVFDEGMKPGGFMEGVIKAHDEGLFDYIGMTTHSESEDVIRYLKDSPYEFDMVTLPFHAANAGRTAAIDYCVERGIGVVAMNPLGGGRLARKAPVLNRIAGEIGFKTLVEPALRFVAHTPGITTALNGITLAEQAEEGAAAVAAGPLSADAAARLRKRLEELYAVVNPRHLCSACGYCGRCPQGILIPKVLEAATDLRIPSLGADTRELVRKRIGEKAEGWDPSACTACGECEAKCPNKLPIAELMAQAAEIWPA